MDQAAAITLDKLLGKSFGKLGREDVEVLNGKLPEVRVAGKLSFFHVSLEDAKALLEGEGFSKDVMGLLAQEGLEGGCAVVDGFGLHL